ncbi:MAG: LamG domain-containing protein [Bacteroidetes bacterium]|nr:LamG domain-containing protein [Bacteroidota bacterium]
MKLLKIFALALLVFQLNGLTAQDQYSLFYDGVDDYVDCGTNPELNITGSITIELWIYLNGPLTIYERLVEKDWATSYFLGGKYGLNGIAFGMDANSNPANVLETATNVLTQSVWTHVAGTWDGATLRIFINGEEVASKPWAVTVDGSTNSTKLGKFYGPDNNFFRGNMDEVRIWNVALTAEQLQENMYKPLDNPELEPNLVAYYGFDEGSGQTTEDLSQYANTGVLGGTTNIEPSDPAWAASTAPIPFYTVSNGDWTSASTWASGQTYPTKDWSRVKINHTVTCAADIGTYDMNIGTGGNLEIGAGQICNIRDLDVNNSGSIQLNENGLLQVEDNGSIVVASGGSFEAYGSPGSEVNITHNTGFYSFDIASGASIAAIYSNFEYMDANGINITGDIDAGFPLRFCSFSNGAVGGTLLTIANSQDITLEGLIFPANTWSGTYNVAKTIDAGQVNILAATGAFAGDAFENDIYNRIDWGGFRLNAKVYLEGPYNGTGMNTMFTDMLPLTQPFSGLPWNYPGTESVSEISENVVDWALIQFRDATDAASATSATTVYESAVFIDSDGNIVGLDGYSPVYFDQTFTNDFFLVVLQRNHLGILSANPLTLSGSSYDYDFTTGAGQAYGDANGFKEIDTGVYGMIGGDSNGDGTINANDKTLYWENEAGTRGYLPSDLNLDGHSSNQDKNDLWQINNGKFSQVPN